MRETFRLILTRHYLDLGGRIGRREFWLFVLGALLAVAATWIVTFALSQTAHRVTPAMNVLFSLVTLGLLPPLAGVGARRLRDVGQSPLLAWLLVLPLAGMQLCQMLAREPFLLPDFVYFYWTYLNLLMTFLGIVLVALLSFWMEPGITQQTGEADRQSAMAARAGNT
jgi:uncharacterized membrane protein YhaH (DUF805 family)